MISKSDWSVESSRGKTFSKRGTIKRRRIELLNNRDTGRRRINARIIMPDPIHAIIPK